MLESAVLQEEFLRRDDISHDSSMLVSSNAQQFEADVMGYCQRMPDEHEGLKVQEKTEDRGNAPGINMEGNQC